MSDPQITVTEQNSPLTIIGDAPTFLEVVEDAQLELAGAESLELVLEEISTPIEVLGTPGPQGPSGMHGIEQFAAGEALSGHRAVAISGNAVTYADNLDATRQNGMVGVTLQAALSGDTVNVCVLGTITEISWSWTPNRPVYLGASGALTQTPPAAPAFQRIVGYATSDTSLFVSVEQPITLAP